LIKLLKTNLDIETLTFEVNKIKRFIKINRRLNSVEFISKDDIDHEALVLEPLKQRFE